MNEQAREYATKIWLQREAKYGKVYGMLPRFSSFSSPSSYETSRKSQLFTIYNDLAQKKSLDEDRPVASKAARKNATNVNARTNNAKAARNSDTNVNVPNNTDATVTTSGSANSHNLGKAPGWTAKEEASLIDAVGIHGYKNWKGIASIVGTKSPTACHQKAMLLLGLNKKPGGTKGPWIQPELDLLKEGIEMYGDDWHMIAFVVGTRTAGQCKERVKNTGLELARTTKDVKAPRAVWTEDGIARLKSAVREL